VSERSERMNDFLVELADLLAKHDAEIGGCGCCGSPWVKLDGEEVSDVDESVREILRGRQPQEPPEPATVDDRPRAWRVVPLTKVDL
jgi:hypothetical protein